MKMYVDMDNTLNELSNVANVWKRLDCGDVSPYMEALPKKHYIEMVKMYKRYGYEIIILSCLSRVTNEEMDRKTIQMKKQWLAKYVGNEWIDKMMFIPYTKHKEQYVEDNGILLDDDMVICMNWNKGNCIVAK